MLVAVNKFGGMVMDNFFIVTNLLTFKQFLQKVYNYTEEQAVAENIKILGMDVDTGNKYVVATLFDATTFKQIGQSWVCFAGGIADALSTVTKQLALEYNLEQYYY